LATKTKVEKNIAGRLVEWLFVRLGDVRHISDDSVFRYSTLVHRGAPVELADGQAILPGQTLVELHLDNDRMAELREESGGGRRFAVAVVHGVRRSMSQVASLVEDMPDVAGLFANTPRRLAPVAVGEGFEMRERPEGLSTRVIGRLQRGALRDYDPQTYERLPAGSRELVPVEIWMSRASLLARHLDRGETA
jgi:hypothetical protein